MSGKRTGFILSILCVIGLFLLIAMYGEAQEQQRQVDNIYAWHPLLGGDLKEPDIHPDILLRVIIVVRISAIAFPLIGFWYDGRTKVEGFDD